MPVFISIRNMLRPVSGLLAITVRVLLIHVITNKFSPVQCEH
jgi:hypothetical protein